MIREDKCNMTQEEKLELLEELFEMDDKLSPDRELNDIEEYDSIAKLAVMVMFEDEFGKKISGDQMRAFLKVKDILDLME